MSLNVLWLSKGQLFALVYKFFKLQLCLSISYFEFMTQTVQVFSYIVVTGCYCGRLIT